MRLIFAGTPAVAVPTLQQLISAGHEVVGVLTRPDAPVGRKRTLTPSPVAAAATELGLPVYKTHKPDAETLDWVRQLGAEVGVVVAYGAILKQDLLDALPLGWINLHFSDLPRLRGAAPVQRALMAGESALTATVFRLVAALDAGAVLSTAEYQAAPGESAGEVLEAMAHNSFPAVAQALTLLAQDADAGSEQVGEATYAHKLTREDGQLDLTQSAATVLAHWAGVTPEPGAFTHFEGQPLKLLRLAPENAQGSAESAPTDPQVAATPGTLTLVKNTAYLTTGDGRLIVERVQPAGKPQMAAADWLRGRGGKAQLG